MKKYYYHVVTESPMELNQEIIFDNIHHSGMYKRVYSLEEKVKEIYACPKKYENVKLEHHLSVALRELAMEEVRKNKYSDYPSRLSSLYLSNTLEDAKKWYNIFLNLGRTTYSIVKVEVNGRIFEGDAWNCFEGTINKNKNLELAENYWSKKNNIVEKPPITEIIADGKIKVIEIIKK